MSKERKTRDDSPGCDRQIPVDASRDERYCFCGDEAVYLTRHVKLEESIDRLLLGTNQSVFYIYI